MEAYERPSGRAFGRRNRVAALLVLLVAGSIATGCGKGASDASDADGRAAVEGASGTSGDNDGEVSATVSPSSASVSASTGETSAPSSTGGSDELSDLVSHADVRYDAELDACITSPAEAFDRTWQISVSFPSQSEHGDHVPAGETVGLGLRNKSGWDADEALDIEVMVVVQRDGSELWSARSRLTSDAWSEVSFTEQFEPRGQPASPGKYVFYWLSVPSDEEQAVGLTCGGFEVSGSDGP